MLKHNTLQHVKLEDNFFCLLKLLSNLFERQLDPTIIHCDNHINIWHVIKIEPMIEQKNLVDQELVGTKLELVNKPNQKASLRKTQNIKILNKKIKFMCIHMNPNHLHINIQNIWFIMLVIVHIATIILSAKYCWTKEHQEACPKRPL